MGVLRGVRVLVAVAVAAVPPLGSRALGAPLFLPLGDLPGAGFQSEAFGVSGDGSVVVGRSLSEVGGQTGVQAFRWTSADGMVGLGDLSPATPLASDAVGVSGDGSVVVGRAFGPCCYRPYRWTASGGMVDLGTLYSTNSDRIGDGAKGVSADGSVVVGWVPSDAYPQGEAFLWTASGGMIGLGGLRPGVGSQGYAVSLDGSVVVGWASSASASGPEAFRWTLEDGMVGLGDLPGGVFGSFGSGVSGDGSVVVGHSRVAAGEEAFLWTADGGMMGLGDLGGGSFLSRAMGISSDGAVVVGRASTAAGNEAFLWDAESGLRNLRSELVELGLDMTGWTLSEATAVANDGLGRGDSITIVGSGTNPSGQQEAWLAKIPEPSTLSLLGAATVGLAVLRRRMQGET
jgi:probable HAF family extracellular repeat protein